MTFIRAKVPVSILLATIGFVVFGLLDLLTERLFSQFISGSLLPTFLSALLGGLIGYALGWRIVRKYGLPLSATPYDVDAASYARKENIS